jgi:hypothetical protein
MTGERNAEMSTLAPEAAPPLTQGEIDRRVFELYDERPADRGHSRPSS